MRYNNLSGYLREKYGKRMNKICIDAGFTCPNRDGKCGTGGCIFCGERGAGEHIDPTLSIAEEVSLVLRRSKDDDLFIAYFQNFTNTYADVATLKKRYDAALTDPRIKILSVGTRPDCIDDDVCKLLKEYACEREVWVELGLQTASDATARIINRGYETEVFDRAMKMLSSYGIRAVVHIIIGLPGEGKEDVEKTVAHVASFKPFGIKIHSIYVMRGTVLEKMYNEKRYTPPTLSEFVDSAVYAIAHIPKETVIHRLTGDCPRDALVAPVWNADKNEILDSINERLKEEDLRQGSLL